LFFLAETVLTLSDNNKTNKTFTVNQLLQLKNAITTLPIDNPGLTHEIFLDNIGKN